MNYEQAIEYISTYTDYEKVPRLPHNAANYDLRRVFELLGRLDNPHLKAKSVHITGTNGKGSVAAMLASVLTASGYTTGLYTSPHLHTWRERIKVDDRLISEQDFVSLVEKLKPEIEAINLEAKYGRLTTFEILTVLSFTYFAQEKADFQVMEVGMGGRYDATSVITPEVSILTPISLEHTDVLGSTLAEIAGEKAAIIKPGGVCVTCIQPDEVDGVIEQVCDRGKARLIRTGKDVTWQSRGFSAKGQALKVEGRLGSYELFIPLLGQHQLLNAAMAVAALEVLSEKGFRVTPDSITRGLANVKWPGRLHVLSRNPVLIVDGAHNPGAAKRLREALVQYFKFDKAILVIGISNDKDIASIVAELSPLFDKVIKVIATRADHPRSTPPERIAAEFKQHEVDVRTAATIPEAIAQAKSVAKEKDLICVAGSLFVVAEAIQNETSVERDKV